MTSWHEFHQYGLENGGMDDPPPARCPDCSGDGEAPRSQLGACVTCPTCGGSGERLPHTPGPWVVKGMPGQTLCVTDKDSAYVVDRFKLGGRPVGEHTANAHLIAAAPDLLAALRKAVNGGCVWHSGADLVEAERILAAAGG
jgi:hypothetical protein